MPAFGMGPALPAPFCWLFCSLFAVDAEDSSTHDQIVALDAQTLQPRYRFGQTMLNDARGMAVVG
ncbi:hypothetical protein, partial [uncultured Microbacterium sp.]|uniref:hypothetical protein n=1 Tax=uncultured Microbacterium sp. TaxID=191216 RepID=UPI0025F91597